MSSIPPTLDPVIVDHFEDPYHQGECAAATHQADGRNTLCGDALSIQLRLDPDSGAILEAWFEGEGCTISLAAASMLMEHVEPLEASQIKEFDACAMLKLLGPSIAPCQQKCGLLAWRVLQIALDSPIEGIGEDAPTFGGPHLGEEN